MQIVSSLNIDIVRPPASERPHLSHFVCVKNLSFLILLFLSFGFSIRLGLLPFHPKNAAMMP